MHLTSEQCLALAQIYPVLLLATMIERRALLRLSGVRSRRPAMVGLVAAFAVGSLGTLNALLAGGQGISGFGGVMLIGGVPLVMIQIFFDVVATEIFTPHPREPNNAGGDPEQPTAGRQPSQ